MVRYSSIKPSTEFFMQTLLFAQFSLIYFISQDFVGFGLFQSKKFLILRKVYLDGAGGATGIP